MATSDIKKAEFVDALAGGDSLTSAARRVGISQRTAFRLWDTPEVRGAVTEALDAIRETTQRRLAAATGAAVDALVAICEDTSAPPMARVRAAQVILEAARPSSDIGAAGFVGIEVVYGSQD